MRKLLAAALLATLVGCIHNPPNPTPTPPPTPEPTPEPTPTPTPNVCIPDPPAQDHWILKIHTVGPNWTTLDATPKVRDFAYCNATGFPALYCPLGAEGDPCREVREKIVVGGDPIWTGPGEVSPEGPYLYRVRHGVAGDVKVCNHFGLCESLHVTGKE